MVSGSIERTFGLKKSESQQNILMKTCKHIGINASMLDERPTGVGVYTYNIINSIQELYEKENGYSIRVYSPTNRHLSRGVSVRILPEILQSSKYGKLAAATRFIWNTLFFPVQSRNMDMLISTTTHGSLISKNQILTIHDLLSLRFNNISSHQRIYFKYILPLLLRRVKKIIAVSECTKSDIINFLNYPAEQITVVHNGYDKDRYYPSSTNSQEIQKHYKVSNYFLAVGPTYPHKNFEKLLHAYNWLPDATKNQFPLVIAGGMTKYVESLKKLAHGIGLENKIHFIGYVPVELMRSLYTEAYALIFPSLYEGFGFPLLEAMACGCPVLCSNTSSMPEVCGEAALYFNPESIEDIASSLRKITLSQSQRQTMIDKGLKQVLGFSWEKSALQVKAIIDQCLN